MHIKRVADSHTETPRQYSATEVQHVYLVMGIKVPSEFADSAERVYPRHHAAEVEGLDSSRRFQVASELQLSGTVP